MRGNLAGVVQARLSCEPDSATSEQAAKVAAPRMSTGQRAAAITDSVTLVPDPGREPRFRGPPMMTRSCGFRSLNARILRSAYPSLIAISIGAYALGWRHTGAGAGVLALFYRELALPYAMIGVILAWRERRRSELLVWLAGMIAYAVYFGLHAMAAMSHMPASGVASSPVLWLGFGGVRFLLMTSRVGLLLGLPFWVAALYLPMALLGLFGWAAPIRLRLIATVGVYLLAFSVVGLPGNFYWGAIYAPLLAYGATWSVPACRDLARAVILK